LHFIVAALFGWLQREQLDALEFLHEENRILRAQLHGRRPRLTDDERRRLAVIGRASAVECSPKSRRSSRRTPFSGGIVS
jgi:hypothetical protein